MKRGENGKELKAIGYHQVGPLDAGKRIYQAPKNTSPAFVLTGPRGGRLPGPMHCATTDEVLRAVYPQTYASKENAR